MLNPQNLRRSMLASAIALACAGPVMGEDVTVAAGTSRTTSASVGGTDHAVVGADATWSVDDTVIKWKDASTALVIDNDGLIESTEEGGRAINASGDGTGARNLVLNNNAGAVIQSESDAFRINTDFSEGQIVVNNAGTIHSTVDGQALDFDSVESTGTDTAASIVINNLAGGVIRADGADGIRPGEGATVNNAGKIYSDGILGDSNDGVDVQGHAGNVVNLAGGTISGQRHGITSDIDVNVYNAAGATITGRNGSGVGSDGTGLVVNYGTITGAYVGTGSGDGDGVDIDGFGQVENWGVIEATGAGGLDKNGDVNNSEAIAITGGGSVVNHAGGIIRGADDGITGSGTFSVTNDGTIEGVTAGLDLAGNVSVTNRGVIASHNLGIFVMGGTGFVSNFGEISGDNYAIRFADGDDTLVINEGSKITGVVDGGSGYDSLVLAGGSFDTAQNFEYLHVTGVASLVGDNQFENALIEGTLQLGNGGTAGSLGDAVTVDNGVLRINRSDAVTFANAVSGTGSFEQAGPGTTTLTGINTFTGATTAVAGTLVIGREGQGSVAGDAIVGAGATLRGSGSIGGQLTVNEGGTLAPGEGATPGILSVAGDVSLLKGSVVDIGVAGDTVHTGGKVNIGNGSILNVDNSVALTIDTPYAVLTTSGGVEGQFSTTQVSDSGTTFLSPRAIYTGSGVFLTLQRNETPLASVASTHTERATANALDALDVATPLAHAVLVLDGPAARTAIDELSGEQFASTRAAMVDNAHEVRDAINRHLMGNDADGKNRSATHGDVTAWVSGFGHDGDNSRGGAARMSSQGGGLLAGADVTAGDGRIGAVAGRGQDNDDVESRNSSARVKSTYLGLYGDMSWDAWHLRGGATYSWQDVDSTRPLTAVETGTRLTAHYDAHVGQAFAEGGYRLQTTDRQWLEPFVGIARIRLDMDKASEGNATGALEVAGLDTDVNVFSLGLRHAITFGAGGQFKGHGSLAWNHASGDVDSESLQRFAGTEGNFTVRGTPIARQTASVEAGLTCALSSRTSLDASYNGQFASHAKDQGARLQLSVEL